MARWRSLLLSIPCLIAWPDGPARAQDVLIDARRFSVEEGLPHRRVTGLAQDLDGFIWVTTPGGLCRFDGYAFTTWTTAEGLSRNDPGKVVRDAGGLLWLCYPASNGNRLDAIDILDPRNGLVQTFRQYFGARAPFRADEPMAAPMTAPDSSLVFSLPGRIVRYHPRSGFTKFEHSAANATVILALRDGSLLAIADDSAGHADVLKRIPMDNIAAPEVVASVAGRLRCAADGGLRHAGSGFEDAGAYLLVEGTDGSWTEMWLAPNAALHEVRAFLDPAEARRNVRVPLGNSLWFIGTAVRSMRPGDDPWTAPLVFDLAARMPDVAFEIFDALIDRAGGLWIGAEFGLYHLGVRRDPFQRLLYTPEIPAGYGARVRGMVATADRLHVNTEAEGYWLLDAKDGRVLMADTSDDLRYGMVGDGSNGVWSADGDMLMHRSADGERLPDGLRLPGRLPWSLLPMPEDVMLLGTYHGLLWVDRTTGLATSMSTGTSEDLDKAVVMHLARDRSGKLLACTSAGLFVLDENATVKERWWGGAMGADSAFHLPCTDVRHFNEDADGALWLATADAGLVHWDRRSGRTRSITRRDGLPSNSVYAVYPDDEGQLWLPTDNGIARFDPLSGQVHTFSVLDGITHNEFNRLAHAQGPDGRLYFGGLNGITVIDPKQLRSAMVSGGVPLVITAVHRFDGAVGRLVDQTLEVQGGGAIEVLPGDRYVTINMALLSFEDPQRILYGWMIDGLDDDLNYQHEPRLRLSLLPYGEHILRIKAQGGNGAWTGNELLVKIHVVRPYYLRWWFVSACVLCLALVVAGIVRSQVAGERRRLQARFRQALAAGGTAESVKEDTMN